MIDPTNLDSMAAALDAIGCTLCLTRARGAWHALVYRSGLTIYEGPPTPSALVAAQMAARYHLPDEQQRQTVLAAIVA